MTDQKVTEDATYEIELVATVFEEQTWHNTIKVIVKIEKTPVVFAPVVRESEESPKLDFGSVSDKTLLMIEDNTGE